MIVPPALLVLTITRRDKLHVLNAEEGLLTMKTSLLVNAMELSEHGDHQITNVFVKVNTPNLLYLMMSRQLLLTHKIVSHQYKNNAKMDSIMKQKAQVVSLMMFAKKNLDAMAKVKTMVFIHLPLVNVFVTT